MVFSLLCLLFCSLPWHVLLSIPICSHLLCLLIPSPDRPPRPLSPFCAFPPPATVFIYPNHLFASLLPSLCLTVPLLGCGHQAKVHLGLPLASHNTGILHHFGSWAKPPRGWALEADCIQVGGGEGFSYIFLLVHKELSQTWPTPHVPQRLGVGWGLAFILVSLEEVRRGSFSSSNCILPHWQFPSLFYCFPAVSSGALVVCKLLVLSQQIFFPLSVTNVLNSDNLNQETSLEK